MMLPHVLFAASSSSCPCAIAAVIHLQAQLRPAAPREARCRCLGVGRASRVKLGAFARLVHAIEQYLKQETLLRPPESLLQARSPLAPPTDQAAGLPLASMANVVLQALVLLGLAVAAAGAPTLSGAVAAAAVSSRLLPPAWEPRRAADALFSAALTAGVAPSLDAPGGLTPEQTPQFILFTVRLSLPCAACLSALHCPGAACHSHCCHPSSSRAAPAARRRP